MNAEEKVLRKLQQYFKVEVLPNEMGGPCEKMVIVYRSDGSCVSRQFNPERLANNSRALGNFVYNIQVSLGTLNEYALPHDIEV